MGIPQPATNANATVKGMSYASLHNNTSRRTAEQVNSDQTFARTEQAAHLLREALALLDVGSKPLTAPIAMKRAPDRLLRLPEVERLTGLRRSAIYEQMQRGIFPRSVKVGPRAAKWSEIAVKRGSLIASMEVLADGERSSRFGTGCRLRSTTDIDTRAESASSE